MFCIFYAGVLGVKILFSDEFIPQTVLDAKLFIIPVAVIVAGFVNIFMNYSMVTTITKRAKAKLKE